MGTETENKNYFQSLYAIDCQGKVKEKNGLKYLPWASAWAEVKKKFPDAYYEIVPQIMDTHFNERPWHDDGRTAWVVVRVTIAEHQVEEMLAIMDFRNKAIPADQVTSVDANKAIKRCLVKACAEHGLALYIYESEDMPEEMAEILEMQEKCISQIYKKVKWSDKAKAEVAKVCKQAESDYTGIEVEKVEGQPKNIFDLGILKRLDSELRVIRK